MRSTGVEACLIRPAPILPSSPDGGRLGFGGKLLPTDYSSEFRPVEGDEGDLDVLVALLGVIIVTETSELLKLFDAIPSYVLVLRFCTTGLGPFISFVYFIPSVFSVLIFIFFYLITE